MTHRETHLRGGLLANTLFWTLIHAENADFCFWSASISVHLRPSLDSGLVVFSGIS